MTTINLNAKDPGERYVPVWKKLICAGRAAEGLREDWRNHFRELQQEIGFEYIRFHGIFHEDMMVYRENAEGEPVYNWQYVDSLFDFLLAQGARPIVELSFMPYALASGEEYVFWWKGNKTPPKDYSKWAELIRAFVAHCVRRYTIEEVLQWYFEVWNEADGGTSFWTGTQEEYFRLYEYSVNAVKSIHPLLRVGGPASTAALPNRVSPWVEDFLLFCKNNNLPVDFVSTDLYPNMWPKDDFGNYIEMFKHKEYIKPELEWVRSITAQYGFEHAESHVTEWNSSPNSRDLVHDTAFMAPFVIYNNVQSIGLADSLGFWVFTDVFEELGAGGSEFHGGFGLMNVHGLKKPSYWGYWFLSRLGTAMLTDGEDHIVCRKGNKIQILMWNYVHYTDHYCKGDFSAVTQLDRYSCFEPACDEQFSIQIEGLSGKVKVTEHRLGRQNGSVYDAWLRNGAMEELSQEDVGYLRKNSGPHRELRMEECDGVYRVEKSIEPHGVCMLEIEVC